MMIFRKISNILRKSKSDKHCTESDYAQANTARSRQLNFRKIQKLLRTVLVTFVSPSVSLRRVLLETILSLP